MRSDPVAMNGWKRTLVCLIGGMLATLAHAVPVVVVQGTSSTPNTAERNYAGSVARRLDGWLTEVGIPHRVVTDEQLSPRTLAGVRVAMLSYNPDLPATELAALKGHLERAGKLIVFYSGDDALARLMGVKLGTYRMDPTATRWTRMHFKDGVLAGGPDMVFQRSRIIRPATPRSRHGQVIAYWEDMRGKRREPAWIQTAAGFWMTHVLLDDGDTARKQQLLVALIGYLDDSVWPVAARAVRQQAETIGVFDSYLAAERTIRRRAPRTGCADRTAAALQEARRTRSELEALEREGRYADVMVRAGTLRAQLLDAYAETFAFAGLRRRGVWDHSGLGLYPGDWDRTAAELSKHGITDVFVNALWPGRALYTGDIVPVSDAVSLYGDVLGDAVASCRAHGLRIHVWKVCWNLDQAPETLMKTLRREGRLQRSDAGDEVAWLCPSNPDNLRYEKDALRDMLKRYEVDGVHLDYIRYPGSYACYCDGCRQRYEAYAGHRVRAWPEAVTEGAERAAYTRWRCSQITRLVRDVSALARKAHPGIELSAAVYGKYPSCVPSVAQDWPGWVNDGLLNFVAPMNYTTSQNMFADLVRSQAGLLVDDRRLCPGIGVTAAESRLRVPAILQQLEEAQARGAGGFLLFDLNRVLAREILPYLKLR